jgi:acyl-homoserine-lactone acylase
MKYQITCLLPKLTRRISILTVFVIAAIAMLADSPTLADSSEQPTTDEEKIEYETRIQRTSYGIPHVRASDWGSLGYGFGYAFAQDNLCVLARDVLVATGTQSRFFGPVGNNVAEDWVYALVNSDARAQASWEQVDPDSQSLLIGYAAGYNRYLRDTGVDGLAPDCRGAAWVRPIDQFDMLKVLAKLTLRAGTANFILSIAGAQPPMALAGVEGAAMDSAVSSAATNTTYKATDKAATNAATNVIASMAEAEQLLARTQLPDFSVERFGSNAVALGEELTGGAGALLGNPHFPWFGIERFYAVHLTLPGRYDVMGSAIYGFPLVNIGFNKNVAWSHTVSTGRRFVVRELQLADGDPTAYVYDGEVVPMTTETVSIEVLLPDESLASFPHTFYLTQFGPIMILPQLANWTTTNAYALTDINLDNVRGIKMYREMGQARNTHELEEALSSNLGLPWVNTVVADSDGGAFYGDITTVPHMTDAKLAVCADSFVARVLSSLRVYTLNGSKSSCDLGSDPDAPQPGIFGPSNLPSLHRGDYVQNSNNSYWLSNPEQRLEGFPQIMGTDEGGSQGFRTRLGVTQIRDRLLGTDDQPGSGFDRQWLQDVLYANRHYSAEIMRGGVLTLCDEEDSNVEIGGGEIVNVSQACGVLASWDGRNNLDSVGTHVWRDLWARMRGISDVYAMPFDAIDPVNTPRDVNLANGTVRGAVMVALGKTVKRYADLSIPLDAAWGQIHFDTRQDGEMIPIHGGSGGSGVYNAISAGGPTAGVGFTPIFGGSSYIQSVGFSPSGPDARAIVTYSQSTNVESAHFSDMTRLFSQYGWVDLPFKQDEIRSDPDYSEINLKE